MICRTTLEPALLEAVKAKKYDVVEAYLRNGAKGTALLDGNDALHIAAMQNDLKMIALLLKYNVAPSTKNTAGETPIMLAAHKGLWDCVIAFAKSRKEDGERYEYGNALRLAAYHNQYKVVKALLEAGASTTWFHRDSQNTPLHDAVGHNNAHMVALLLLYRADPSKQNAQNETPVLLAAKRNFWACSHAFVGKQKLLIKEVSDIQIILFYLFSANSHLSNPFSRIPYDVLKLILDISFSHLSPDIYTFNAAKEKYVDLRPDRRYVYSVSNFIKSYSQFGFWRQAVNSQSAESIAFVKSLENIVVTRESVDERAEKLRKAINVFTALKGDQTSRAMTLLMQHNLIQTDSHAASNVKNETRRP